MKKMRFYLYAGLFSVFTGILVFHFTSCDKEEKGGFGIDSRAYFAWTDPMVSPSRMHPSSCELKGGIGMPFEYEKGGSEYGEVLEYGFIVTSNEKYNVYYDELPFDKTYTQKGNIGKNEFNLGEHSEYVIKVQDQISIKLMKELSFKQNFELDDFLYSSLKTHFKKDNKTKEQLYYLAYVISKVKTTFKDSKSTYFMKIDLGKIMVFNKDIL